MDDNEEILNKLIDLTIMIILLMMKKYSDTLIVKTKKRQPIFTDKLPFLLLAFHNDNKYCYERIS